MGSMFAKQPWLQRIRCRSRFASLWPTSLLLVSLVSAQAAPNIVFLEDFESGNTNGWVMTAEGSSALAGDWVIGDPNGTVDPGSGEPAQPEWPSVGAGCAFTAQNSSLGFHDVDDGYVVLTSPTVNLSGATAATLEYDRWFCNLHLGDDPSDALVIEAREDDVSNWVELERIGDDLNANAWVHRSVALEQFIALTATVQIRFVASDGAWPSPQDIIEAAIDEVRITTEGCVQNEDCDPGNYCDSNGSCAPYGSGDIDSDGDVDLADYRLFLICFGAAGTGQCAEANLAGDIGVSLEDYAALASQFSGPF